MRRKRKDKPKPLNMVVTPFVVAIDNREQAPWDFQGFQSDARDKYAEIIVRTKRGTLKTGDYSIEGFEDKITIERKSLDDAFGTFGENRQRWYLEMHRMLTFEFAAVIIEAGWGAILSAERPLSAGGRCFSPKQFYRSVVSWQIRYPCIQWWFCPTRQFAQRTCLRLLQRFWELEHEHAPTTTD